MEEPETHIGIRREMHDTACTAHPLGQAARIEKITLEKSKISVSVSRCNKFPDPGAEIVVTDNHLAIRQQPVDQIAADKPGGACNKDRQLETVTIANASAGATIAG